MGSERRWPSWWDWSLEVGPHAYFRMVDRGFSETDVRRMLGSASGFRPSSVEGRWVVRAVLHGRQWEVIVEPDDDLTLLVLVTAYPLED